MPELHLYSTEMPPYRKKIVEYWIAKGYLENQPVGETWHTITGWQPSHKYSSGGPAKCFWYHAGCSTDEAADEWIRWSDQHPHLAARLWPKVIDLLKDTAKSTNNYGYYASAAALMRSVRDTKNELEFDRGVKEWETFHFNELGKQGGALDCAA